MPANKLTGWSTLLLLFSVLQFPAAGLTPSTLTLTASPNPTFLGTTVTLVATVTPPNATGRVTFYDGAAILGTNSVSGGTASLLTGLLPSGTHKLRAYYAGDSGNGASTSNFVMQAVNARPTVGFAVGPSPGNVGATLKGDFNGDGIMDLANGLVGTTILLGRGDGTFHQVGLNVSFSSVPVAVADFNGDGKADLLIVHLFDLYYLAGKGDGTFQPPTWIGILGFGAGVVVADFNGDGAPDIALPDPSGVLILKGNGDGTFQTPTGYAMPSGASMVTLGDFNGDGKADLAVGKPNGVQILLGNGDGTFQTPLNDLSLGPGTAMVVADFNKDGKADLAAISSQNKILVQLGNGDGTFGPIAVYAAGSPTDPVPASLAVEDFNGDGNADLATASATTAAVNVVSILYGNGDGTLRPAAVSTSNSPGPLITGDFNRDGKADLLDGSYLLVGTTLSVTATGTAQSTMVGTAFPSPLEVTIRDGASPVIGIPLLFSGVGPTPNLPGAFLSNITVTTDASGTARVTATASQVPGSYIVTTFYAGLWAIFSLTNTVGPPAALTVVSGTPQAALTGTPFPNPLRVSLTDSAGNPYAGVNVSFAGPSAGATAALSGTIATTDASGVASVNAAASSVAGRYVVTASFGSLSATFSLTNALTSGLALTTLTNPSVFGAPVTLTATVTPSNATGRVTFYDGVNVLGTKAVTSGVSSLSTTLPTGTRKLAAYYSGDGSYLPARAAFTQTVKSVAAVGFRATAPVGVGSPLVSAVGDFNGDGKTDVAVLGTNAVVVLLGNGDGTFRAPTSYPVTMNVVAMAIADMNNDGNPDIILDGSDSLSNGMVSVLAGNGDGTFRPAVNSIVGISISSFAHFLPVADFNHDGTADLLLPAFRPALLLGNGDGTFRPAIVLQPFVSSDSTFAVGDFNGDGNPDLVYSGSGLQMVLGNGDGTFGPPSTISANAFFGTLLVSEDFNGDGKLDLVAGGSIFLGNGDGTFQAAGSLPVTGNSIVASDFDGDGVMDLAMLTTGTSAVSVLRGNGDGTFHLVLSYTTSQPLTSLAAADFNGDGRVDLVGPSNGFPSSQNSLNILLGVTSGTSLTVFGGSPQSAIKGVAFAVPLQAIVVQNGSPVFGAIVTFAAPSSGPSAGLSPAAAVTNTAGIAAATATANNTSGSYTVTASYQGLTASFSLTNSEVASIVASGGTPQSALLYSPFAKQLEVTVRDTAGNLAGGVVVSFAGPTTGAGLNFLPGPITTDANGQAIVQVFANNLVGSYTVTASAAGHSASFALTNATVDFTISGGNSQAATVGAAFGRPLEVTIRDSAGNALTNLFVNFSAPTTGASALLSGGLTGAGAYTNVAGVAIVNATANNIPGSYTLTATIQLTSGTFSVAFSLTNLPSGVSNTPPSPGVFRNGAWYVDWNRNNQWDSADAPHIFALGQAGDVPVMGDWNGDGRLKMGIFRNGVWLVDWNGNNQWDATDAAHVFFLGQAGDLPVVGDWNGDGRLKIGIFRNGLWIVDWNGNGQWDATDAAHVFVLGQAGDRPVVGDWNGDGRLKIGIFRNGLWIVDWNGNNQWDASDAAHVFSLGQAGDLPVMGDWNGDGRLKAGVFRNGIWLVDWGGNNQWDASDAAHIFFFGLSGDSPVMAAWN